MCERRTGSQEPPRRGGHRACVRALAFIVMVLALAAPTSAAESSVTEADRRLLERSDLALATPETFRMRLKMTPLSAPARATEVEVWRSPAGTAVELLGERDAGKRFLQRPDGLWFLAPGARPVKLSPSHRLAAGISLQEILLPSYSRDYEIETVRRQGTGENEVVVFELTASAPGLAFPLARYVVRAANERPERIELLASSKRIVRRLEITEWARPEGLEVRRMVATDLLGRGGVIELEVLELEARDVPAELLELGEK